MDIAELHSQALDATREVIAGVRQGQWAVPTPCQGWDVRALVNHVVAGNLWAAELAAGATISEVGDHLDGDVLGADPLAAYDASAKRRPPYSPSRARSRRRALSPTARSLAWYTPVTVSSTCSSTAGTWPSPLGRIRSSALS